ncbi:MAG: malate synthase G [Woeseia sp.]
MSSYVTIAGLQVATVLHDFIRDEVIPGTGLDANDAWEAFASLLRDLTPRNRRLIGRREELQTVINGWHLERAEGDIDAAEYRDFLESIGYIVPEDEPFTICPANIDAEIATVAGPQLVVPVLNARFALNAANARWGSLYDALYGTDVIEDDGDSITGKGYDPERGARVIHYVRGFLDEIAALDSGSHKDAVAYTVVDGKLCVALETGAVQHLQDRSVLAGYRGSARNPEAILLCHHGLHAEVVLDRNHEIGKTDAAGIADVIVESALTTIMDFEDSVAAVDADDKAAAYANWLGLIQGKLVARFTKDGRTVTRRMNNDREYTGPDGKEFSLPGRSLMMARNVGHLMTTPAVLDAEGAKVFEGLLDGFVTTLIALHDINGGTRHRNSRCGSIYIVKPKLHGPEEAAFTGVIFRKIEEVLGLPAYTVKIGLMDEERRTSVNLKECIRPLKERIFFINTGFLDRTGDEIHTSMYAGPMLRKGAMKDAPWLRAYEDRNVDIGIACGFPGRAQIGKGMWPMPDRMAEMMSSKSAHPEAGANTAWVPSPTAATLHALHYHQVDVAARQRELAQRETASLEKLLTIPLGFRDSWTDDAIQQELDNNIQGILGYVVRWVDHGVGCSKVPDINDVGLMEDRATLRIASQHVANWLYHGVCGEQQVRETMRRIAVVVDRQNASDPEYQPMAPSYGDSIAFAAAEDLIFAGRRQPNGYTEPILHRRRKEAKHRSKT